LKVGPFKAGFRGCLGSPRSQNLLDQHVVCAERFLHVKESLGQHQLFNGLMNRGFGEQILLERIQVGVAILGQPVAIGLGQLGGKAQ
jgi:hypothetical protein